MPIAMPAAPYASAATSPRPSKKPPAAIDGDVDSVDDLREEQRRRHRAGVATALAALHEHRVDAPCGDLLGVAPGADRRHDDDAGVLETLDEVLARRQREATRPSPLPR